MANPAISVALFAAARQKDGEETIESRLKSANARSHGSAVALDLDDKGRKRLGRAIDDGTVKRTADGRLYLCEQRIAERREGQGFMALLILLGIASVAASFIALIGSEFR